MGNVELKFSTFFFSPQHKHRKTKHCLTITEEIHEILGNYLSFVEHSVFTLKIYTE